MIENTENTDSQPVIIIKEILRLCDKALSTPGLSQGDFNSIIAINAFAERAFLLLSTNAETKKPSNDNERLFSDVIK